MYPITPATGKIRAAFVYGSIAKGQDTADEGPRRLDPGIIRLERGDVVVELLDEEGALESQQGGVPS